MAAASRRVLLASSPRCQRPVRRFPDCHGRGDRGTWDIGPFDNDTAADSGVTWTKRPCKNANP
ncbi:hypothetical protein KPP03845_107301 [Streptomyces xanthophaeus]|nr:hypothetical protein KPP03845_107301 [Streptomyces xanthophaeus]